MKQNFLLGFLRQNTSVIVDGRFDKCDEVVYGKQIDGKKDAERLLGDIDGCYTSKVRTNLTRTLASPHRLSNYDYFNHRTHNIFWVVS